MSARRLGRKFFYIFFAAFLVSILFKLWSANQSLRSVAHDDAFATLAFEARDDRPGSNATQTTTGNYSNYDIHAFYYAWYRNLDNDGGFYHWNHQILPSWMERKQEIPPLRHRPPLDIGASFYPKLGPYSSRDLRVITDHMRQIKKAGIGVLSVSWYPPGLHDDNGVSDSDLMPLFDQAHSFGLKICFHIEPFQNRSIITMRNALRYIELTYGIHPAFYKRPDPRTGKLLPLYYIYDSYLMDFSEWKILLKPASKLLKNEKFTVRDTEIDGLFIGLLVKRKHLWDMVRSGFDGFYTYFGTKSFTYGSNPQNWFKIAEFARKEKMLFIPSVAPGYDDLRVRPWNIVNSMSRLEGAYYEQFFQTALRCKPPIISITSFNEWHEGTQIEEAIPFAINSFTYLNYLPHEPNYYLGLTKKLLLNQQ